MFHRSRYSKWFSAPKEQGPASNMSDLTPAVKATLTELASLPDLWCIICPDRLGNTQKIHKNGHQNSSDLALQGRSLLLSANVGETNKIDQARRTSSS